MFRKIGNCFSHGGCFSFFLSIFECYRLCYFSILGPVQKKKMFV
jgi:hypothetical protein